MSKPTVTDALHTENHPAYARGSDDRHLAGEVLNFPVSSQVSGARIANHENYVGYMADKAGVSKDDVRGALNQLRPPAKVLKLPGVD